MHELSESGPQSVMDSTSTSPNAPIEAFPRFSKARDFLGSSRAALVQCKGTDLRGRKRSENSKGHAEVAGSGRPGGVSCTAWRLSASHGVMLCAAVLKIITLFDGSGRESHPPRNAVSAQNPSCGNTRRCVSSVYPGRESNGRHAHPAVGRATLPVTGRRCGSP